jgi:predicted nucleic acid-binding protein
VVIIDTSVLIASLTGPKTLARDLRSVIEEGERVLIPTIVLYEWLRGPRLREELAAQEALFPRASALPFGPQEAAVSAQLYRTVRRPRGRELDLAIAASAMVRNAVDIEQP